MPAWTWRGLAEPLSLKLWWTYKGRALLVMSPPPIQPHPWTLRSNQRAPVCESGRDHSNWHHQKTFCLCPIGQYASHSSNRRSRRSYSIIQTQHCWHPPPNTLNTNTLPSINHQQYWNWTTGSPHVHWTFVLLNMIGSWPAARDATVAFY